MIIPRSCGTHDGSFHADEVTACALLQLFDLVDADKIVRTRDPQKLAPCEYVCDVGGLYEPKLKRFDHHQANYRGPMSSAGMVLDYLKGGSYLTPKEYDLFNNTLVRGVDAHDNGRDMATPGITTFSHIIANFTPIHYDATPEEQTAAFHQAREFALGHLQRMWQRHKLNLSYNAIIATAMAEGRDVLIFEQAIPWMEGFFEQDGARHPARFIIMPSGKFWKLRGIPPTADEKMKVRQPLPEAWAGLLDDELQKASGLDGALFCHKGRFISVWATKDAALTAASKVLGLRS